MRSRVDTFWTQPVLMYGYLIEDKPPSRKRITEQLTLMSVVLSACKLLRTRLKTGNRNALPLEESAQILMYIIDSKDGERGRNRAFNLLIRRSFREILSPD